MTAFMKTRALPLLLAPLLLAGAISGGGAWYDTTRPMAFGGFTGVQARRVEAAGPSTMPSTASCAPNLMCSPSAACSPESGAWTAILIVPFCACATLTRRLPEASFTVTVATLRSDLNDAEVSNGVNACVAKRRLLIRSATFSSTSMRRAPPVRGSAASSGGRSVVARRRSTT